MTYDELYNNMRDYEWAKQYLNLRLIKHGWDENLVPCCPHYSTLDFDVIPMLNFDLGDELGIENVTYYILDWWNVSEEQVFADAMTKIKETGRILTIKDAISELLADTNEKETLIYYILGEPEDAAEMYIMTNQTGFFGGSQLLNQNAITEFAEKVNSPLMILPSSVHELILVPADRNLVGDADTTAAYFNQMICDVNQNLVRRKEWLSDHGYILEKNEAGEWILKLLMVSLKGEVDRNGTC